MTTDQKRRFLKARFSKKARAKLSHKPSLLSLVIRHRHNQFDELSNEEVNRRVPE